MTVSNEAIGAATESVMASLSALELGWVDTDMPDGVTIDVRDFDLTAAISAALEAAAPYIQAAALEDAADALDQSDVGRWLRTCAAALRPAS